MVGTRRTDEEIRAGLRDILNGGVTSQLMSLLIVIDRKRVRAILDGATPTDDDRMALATLWEIA